MSEPLDTREEEWTALIDGEFEVIHGGLRQSVVPLEVHKSSLAANREQKAEIERLARLLKASEDWREAYQKGKYELYAMGGDVLEAAANHLPCNEGPLDRQARKAVGRPEIRSEVVRAEKAEAELASLRASAGEKWIDVKQELPHQHCFVLVTWGIREGIVAEAYCGAQDDKRKWILSRNRNIDISSRITHWKPIPAPPTLPKEKEVQP
jgi:hypothetical protein